MTERPRQATAVCRARELIAELQIESPEEILIEKIAPYKGAPIRYAALSGCDGQMVRNGNSAIITVRESIDWISQRRFVIAHELGHVLLHPEICQVDEVDQWQTRNFNHNQNSIELEANYFASELLMPKILFEADSLKVEPSWDSIDALAKRYSTTKTSAAIQFVHYSKEAVILVASDAGERSWFVFGERARDFYLRDELRLHKYTCARELLDDNKTHSRAETVPAGAWFDRFDPNGKECVVEDSIRGRDSKFVLSLLWIRDDI